MLGPDIRNDRRRLSQVAFEPAAAQLPPQAVLELSLPSGFLHARWAHGPFRTRPAMTKRGPRAGGSGAKAWLHAQRPVAHAVFIGARPDCPIISLLF